MIACPACSSDLVVSNRSRNIYPLEAWSCRCRRLSCLPFGEGVWVFVVQRQPPYYQMMVVGGQFQVKLERGQGEAFLSVLPDERDAVVREWATYSGLDEVLES